MWMRLQGAAQLWPLFICICNALTLPTPPVNTTDIASLDSQTNGRLSYRISTGTKLLDKLDSYIVATQILAYLSRLDRHGTEPRQTFEYKSVFIQVSVPGAPQDVRLPRYLLVWILGLATGYLSGQTRPVEVDFTPQIDGRPAGLIQFIPIHPTSGHSEATQNITLPQRGNETNKDNSFPGKEGEVKNVYMTATSSQKNSNLTQASVSFDHTNTTEIAASSNANIATTIDYVSNIDYGYANFYWLLSNFYGILFHRPGNQESEDQAYAIAGCALVISVLKADRAVQESRPFVVDNVLDGLDRILAQTIRLRLYEELLAKIFDLTGGTTYGLGSIMIGRNLSPGRSDVQVS
ncbi:uncharacterized protein KY384_008963 [Bacidia gigantensis]|uniref:uncharacterized protein n=1 Tax=Bacidia gigantensis TaxID=2732470 RepID=UPI001D05029B|nr:uncharacterized protein KY384_008963 [Bacidia gigantensis]KAG8525319.1 hypothetical protein KY384_008963 [Bacidia gigantensis]